jgi:hypothetical protein
LRGIQTVLVEAGDFAGSTSGTASKIMQGGKASEELADVFEGGLQL